MSIRSIYILKNLFNLIIKKKYLDIISYNKNLKIKLEINIEDYKNESKKIRIGEKMDLQKNLMPSKIYYYLKVNI